jgi:FtsH-binding integral membrane protein
LKHLAQAQLLRYIPCDIRVRLADANPASAGTTEGISMSDFDRDIATARTGYRPEVAIDAGLRAYMIRVYNYMTAGVALTGLVARFTFSAAVTQTGAGLELTPFGHTLFGSPLMWVVILAPLGLVMVMSFGINRLSPATALALFFVYSGLLG